MRDCPGLFLLNFYGLSLLLLPSSSCPDSTAWEGENIRGGDENVAQRLHSHSGSHAFNKSKEWKGGREEKREKGGEGATCCLNIHSLT